MSSVTNYAGPVVTTDAVVLSHVGDQLQVLVHARPREPFAGALALPGVYVHSGETIADATRRCLAGKTGMRLRDADGPRLIDVYDAVERDPRGHALSVVTVAFVEPSRSIDDALARWLPVGDGALGLAFDHDDIVRTAVAWALAHVYIDRFVLAGLLAGTDMTTASVRRAVASVGVPDNVSNIRRSLAASGLLRPSGSRAPVPHGKPALVWEWVQEADA